MAFLPSKPHKAFPPMAEINVTPLVDIMLVLLIVFMITAPMLKQTIPINLPKTAPLPMVDPGQFLMVSLTESKKIYVDDQLVSQKNFIHAVAQAMQTHHVSEVLLEADQSLRYGFVSLIISELKKAGIEKVGLVSHILPAGS